MCRAAGVIAAAACVTAMTQVQTGPWRQIEVRMREGTSMAAAVSPNRQSIAIDLLGSLYVLPFGGGEATKVTPDDLEARQPSWSPDGRSLAFQGFGEDDAWHIYTIRSNGDALKRVTSGSADDEEAAWSHDGRRILFSSVRSGYRTVWQVTLESGQAGAVTSREGSDPNDHWPPRPHCEPRARSLVGRRSEADAGAANGGGGCCLVHGR